MGIGGVGDYSDFRQNYRMPNIRQSEVSDAQDDSSELMELSAKENESGVPLSTQRKDALLEDISMTFNKQDDFGHIGQDSDIHTLDVEKAISDMKKDQVLIQYQYFVGDRSNVMAKSVDGVVFAK